MGRGMNERPNLRRTTRKRMLCAPWFVSIVAAVIAAMVVTMGHYWPLGEQQFHRHQQAQIMIPHIRSRFINDAADRVEASMNGGYFGMRRPYLDGKLSAFVEMEGGGYRKVYEATFEDGVLAGMLRRWSRENGQLILESEYRKYGKGEVVSRIWYPDGTMREYAITNGGITLEHKLWNRNGELIMHSKRVDGKIKNIVSKPRPEDVPEWLDDALILRTEDGPPE